MRVERHVLGLDGRTATNRRTPAARDAASRLSMPSVRSRLVNAKLWSNFLKSMPPFSAVIW
jgi:hypothetical protein